MNLNIMHGMPEKEKIKHKSFVSGMKHVLKEVEALVNDAEEDNGKTVQQTKTKAETKTKTKE